MTETSRALRPVTEIPDMRITLSDGCQLSARVWMPEDAASDPVPAILEYLPYRKRDGTTARDALTHPWFAARGYACIRVDIRGNGDSDGLMSDEYSEQELSDAVEVIEWLAAQPWCAGTVGMMGISWGGFNGLQVAYRQPEPLKAVITLCSTVDRFADDIHYKGGCLLNENFAWSSVMWSYSSRPSDPALRPDWREIWLKRIENEPFLISTWLRHQRRDAYWRHGSICEDYSRIKAKVLAISGWGDGYLNTVAHIVNNIPGAKGINGPWVHKYPHFAVPGPRIGFLQEALRWWDRWLKDIDTGVEGDPAYRHYLMDSVPPRRRYDHRPGLWLADDTLDWATETWPLAPGRLGGKAEPLQARVASPQHCGLEGGEYYGGSDGPEWPGDQRVDDALSACFDSTPLQDAADIVGAPLVRLRVSADRPWAQLAVRLCDVAPDGSSQRITWGMLNLTHRNGHDAPEPLVPGQSVDVAVRLDHIAYRVPAGHRLRLAISTAYWPMVWPMPAAAEVTVHEGALDVAVRPTAQGDEWRFPPPDAAPPQEVEELRPAVERKEVTTDMVSGTITQYVERDEGKQRDVAHGLISGSVAREWWTIHPDDPLTARARTHWTEEVERDDIRTRTETFAEMWSDATHFHMSGRLEAYENDKLVYARNVTDKVSRDHM
ncbi:CocE/NonD family hydrolase [Lutimaribacter sp. EGI FJ00015]|uniref:CocE/NonD family hydrolase n=1 Tax=Lutimaribacter degradans TaxID=2945989 RepID=A0ACC5ZZV8_9RHOB|nr:CocE/NonD family hydrolase [Lutimaribacter sp. EGI FJ00013]MCM2563286.1 CocE/NonD family hydrolase [Lutimaribacter sp. EGI FJ00013]MCO0614391.1 CocE/NonD family hydrolase [Lutimaribacter sp. EGI FJ00015]MCO0636008.1 CocE/NonD family hydrolase [Lutimaribacter sp. EGI FJ00014]